MRLIDADRLKEVLDRNFYGFGWDDVAKQLIDAQPTVDPVKYGYWITYLTLPSFLRCSQCRNGIHWDENKKPNYCPHCGVKMAKETNNVIKYGHWIFRRIGKGYIRECSECHTWPKNLSDKDLQYCKNCGAKMVEEKT